MWEIQIQWAGQWVTVQRDFKSQDDAEWRIAQWKQTHRCAGDPFRAVKSQEK